MMMIQWLGGSVGPRARLEAFRQEKISSPYLDLNLGPSNPWPSRFTDCLLSPNRRSLPSSN